MKGPLRGAAERAPQVCARPRRLQAAPLSP